MDRDGIRTRTLAVLAGATAIWLGLALPMSRGEVYTFNDSGLFHLPLRHFYAECLRKGESFLWFPGMFCGYYLQGEGQAGMCHPLHLALYRCLPLAVAFNLECLLCYPAAMLGTAVFLVRRGLPRDAAAFGGLVFAFAGFNVFHYPNPNALAVVAHLPWLLAALDVLIQDRKSPRRAAWAGLAVGLLTASQLLLGYPQYVFYSLIVEAAYAIALAWSLGLRDGGIALIVAAWAKLLGALTGAIQLLPTADLLAHSTRAEPGAGLVGSLDPLNLAFHVAPYLTMARAMAPGAGPTDYKTIEFGLYDGAVVPALLAWLWCRRRSDLPAKRLALGAVLLAIASILLAIGEHSPLFEATDRLPLSRFFRFPARYLVLYHLALATLAAIALADLARIGRDAAMPTLRRLWPLALPTCAAIAVALGASILVRQSPELARVGSVGQRAAGVLLAAGAAILVVQAARGRRRALVGLVALAALDQGVFALSYAKQSEPTRRIDEYAASWPQPPAHAPKDLRTTGVWPFNNTVTMSGHRMLEGYAGLWPRKRLTYKPAMAAVSGVGSCGWVSGGQVQWAVLPAPLGRTWLVEQALPSSNPDADIERINPRTTALVDAPLTLDPGVGPASARIVIDRPGEIGVLARSPGRRLLVLAESHHEGWNVEIDGQAAEPIRANGDYLGVVVGPGRHQVRFRFQPRSFRNGAILSAIGLGLLLATFVITRLRVRAAARHIPRPVGLWARRGRTARVWLKYAHGTEDGVRGAGGGHASGPAEN